MSLKAGFEKCFKLFSIGFFGFGIVFTASSLPTAQPSEHQRVVPICNPNWVDEVPAPGSRVARLSTGSEYRFCVPKADWQHLVVYIHGANFEETSIAGIRSQIEVEGQAKLADLINMPSLFGLPTPAAAFAIVSRIDGVFSEIAEARAEIEELVELFWASAESRARPRGKTILFGVSQGGQFGVSLLEKDEVGVVDGAISACAPIGNFQRQLDYTGDVLNVFDYFYAERLRALGVGVDRFVVGKRTANGIRPKVPSKIKKNWLTGKKLERKLERHIRKARKLGGEEFERLRQFLRVSDVATLEQYLNDRKSTAEEVVLALRGAILGLDLAVSTLGPFYGNRTRIYSGSDNDSALNAGIQRFDAKARALKRIARDWESSGEINRPLVTLHTSADPRVPFWHELAYQSKVTASGSSDFFTAIPVVAFGHCNFSPTDGAKALLTIYAQVLGSNR